MIYYIKRRCAMSSKSANVSVRIQPEIKKEAEAVLDKLGLPVSVVIDTLYRQIILTGGIPYSLTIPKIPALDGMTREEFDNMMNKGYQEAVEDKGVEVSAAFAKLREGLN